MGEKLQQLNDVAYEKYLTYLRGTAESEEASVSEDRGSSLFGVDDFAPDGEKTIDAVLLTDHIWEIAKERYPKNSIIQQLNSIYQKIDAAFKKFNGLMDRRHSDYEDHFSEVGELKKALDPRQYSAAELQAAERILEDIRSEVLNSDLSDFFFSPNFQIRVYTRNTDGHLKGEVVIKDGKPEQNGNFVAVNPYAICLHKIPFSLGLQTWQILAAREENLEKLMTLRLEKRLVNDRKRPGFKKMIWDKIRAKPYKDAKARTERLQKEAILRAAENKKYAEADAHPEIFDMEREALISETEHTFFIAAFRDLIYESLEDLIGQLRKMKPEEIAELRVILVDNRGDDGEREYFGHQRKNSGKRRGTGLPGGGAEKDKAARYLASFDLLASKLAELAKKSELALKIFSHGFREFINECCHALTKLHVRFGRVQKGNNHVDHFCLGSATKEQVQNCAESNEIIKTIYPTLREWYKMALGDCELMKLYDVKEPYFFHAREFAAGLFRRYDLPMFEEMQEFLKIAKR